VVADTAGAEHDDRPAFDLLAVNAVDIRSQRSTTRRGRLESLAVWEPPLQLTGSTYLRWGWVSPPPTAQLAV
jgi:hypothetical protein